MGRWSPRQIARAAAFMPASSLALTISVSAATAVGAWVVTVTSTYASTVTHTGSSLVPVVTTATTCTVQSTPSYNGCSEVAWVQGTATWREYCSGVSVTGGVQHTLVPAYMPIFDAYQCYFYCTIYSTQRSGFNYYTVAHSCEFLPGDLRTVSAPASVQAATMLSVAKPVAATALAATATTPAIAAAAAQNPLPSHQALAPPPKVYLLYLVQPARATLLTAQPLP
ncbi:hypothetical protein BO82DRAFT_421037 [Aspergillus uvarum CBS 121591]|uniref:Apple domain-containing protein n=1 Tax=Aspergillus uvarum CBS 121591 TaxID=1448315 RepID=A0A319C158_9EURO|nr:hypothetical protein BO82DRAFT_421037 [Aspergillus uvarum CBS 121591]PYH78785.1 hypothetical protein BO82DRAFT_421037 [Aspergillus uvarum CBS 121591]